MSITSILSLGNLSKSHSVSLVPVDYLNITYGSQLCVPRLLTTSGLHGTDIKMCSLEITVDS
jgi:hypothetical protein